MPDLLIRRAAPSDAEAYVCIFETPRVVWGTLQLPYPSLEHWRARLADPPDGMYSLVACDNAASDQPVIGVITLHTFPHNPRRRHVAQLGMMVHDDWQGKGVGTALMQAATDFADKWLNITRIELEVFTDNEPALRLYKKFGFEIEGTLRMHAFRDGTYVDSYFMARLRDENS